MTQDQYIIRRKLNILDLGKTLGNISEACRKLGVSRQHYYDIKSALQEEGLEGLLEKSRKRPRVGNRVPDEIEQKILDYSLQFPTRGQVRVANELKMQGVQVSEGGVRAVWLRHGIEKKAQRLKRLETWAAETNGILTETQVQALERLKEDREVHGEIETHHPGFLLGQDTYYVGYIKGVGKIYQQTGIDTYSNVGFAKLYLDKTALAAADFLNDRVLPFFDRYGMRVLRTLTDNGTEYCGKVENHPYKLFLHLSSVEHSTTKICRPQSNGITERLNQTIQEEFYAVALRKKLYTSLDALQVDLDLFMDDYNAKRTNQGRYCKGRTPLATFEDALSLYEKYVIEGVAKEEMMH